MSQFHSETKYAKVAANTVDDSGGIVPSLNQMIGVMRFRANGADPTAYVILVWDFEGDDEFVFTSTKGDIDLKFDTSLPENIITGDGVKALKVVIINENTSESPYIGGSVEIVEIL